MLYLSLGNVKSTWGKEGNLLLGSVYDRDLDEVPLIGGSEFNNRMKRIPCAHHGIPLPAPGSGVHLGRPGVCSRRHRCAPPFISSSQPRSPCSMSPHQDPMRTAFKKSGYSSLHRLLYLSVKFTMFFFPFKNVDAGVGRAGAGPALA